MKSFCWAFYSKAISELNDENQYLNELTPLQLLVVIMIAGCCLLLPQFAEYQVVSKNGGEFQQEIRGVNAGRQKELRLDPAVRTRTERGYDGGPSSASYWPPLEYRWRWCTV